MRTIIFSGPLASGKTTKAYLLRAEISPSKEDHWSMDIPNTSIIPDVAMSICNGNYKTVLLDGHPVEFIVKLGGSLYNNGFKGVFIATSLDKELDLAELIGTHDVQVKYLHRLEKGTVSDRIRDAIRPIACEHGVDESTSCCLGALMESTFDFSDGTRVIVQNKSGIL